MSAERGEKLSLLAVHNKTIILEQKADAAFMRIDELKKSTAASFVEISAGLREINSVLQDLRDWKNRALGWAAAAIFLASILGASIATAVIKIMAFPAAPVSEQVVGPHRK